MMLRVGLRGSAPALYSASVAVEFVPRPATLMLSSCCADPAAGLFLIFTVFDR